jgi:Tfp pilus assembly protein PilF
MMTPQHLGGHQHRQDFIQCEPPARCTDRAGASRGGDHLLPKGGRHQSKYPEAHNNLAHSLQMLGRSEEALAHLRKALEIKPRYADAHNNLGLTLHIAGRPDAAIRHFEQALTIKPNYPPHYQSG